MATNIRDTVDVASAGDQALVNISAAGESAGD